MDFKKNLRYLITIWAEGEEKKFADLLGWGDHTLRRLVKGQQAPLPQHYFALHKAFGVTDETINAPHDRFLRVVVPELRRDIALATPECVKDEWPRTILLKAALGETKHILYWFSSGRHKVCGAELQATGFDREGVHITFSFKRDVRMRHREGRLICIGDFIYMTAWPSEGSHQLIYGILRNQPSAGQTPYDGWMVYPSAIQENGSMATAIVRSRVRLSPVPTFGGQGAETQRRSYMSERTGLLKRPPDEDVRKFFMAEIAAR